MFDSALFDNSNIERIIENDKHLLTISVDNLLFGPNGMLKSPRDPPQETPIREKAIHPISKGVSEGNMPQSVLRPAIVCRLTEKAKNS